MSQMSQFKSKSGIKIVPPVPTRAASALRAPSSEGAKECSPRRKPWEADPHPPHKPRRGERNALEVKYRPCGDKIGPVTCRRNSGAPFLASFARSGKVRRHQHDPGRKETGKGTTSVVPPTSTNFPGFSRGAAQECSPRRKPWGQRHKSQPSPGGAEETPFESNIGRAGTKSEAATFGRNSGAPFLASFARSGKFADINTTREGKKPGRARLRSCRQAAPTSPGLAAERRKNAAHGASRGGSATNLNQAPEGRKNLIPNISLIVRNVVLLEERNKLLLKRMLLMMVLLIGDIFRDSCNIRFAHAEDPVSGLPREFCVPFFMHPAR